MKTTVKCNGCVATVTPFLNNLQGLNKWTVDLEDPQRTLTAEVSGISADDVIASLRKAGHNGEVIR